MRGHLVTGRWQHDPTLHAPPRYRHACSYEAFVPEPVTDFEVHLPAALAGVIADAERAIHDLNRQAHPALAPLARLLLRTESIASSRIEGMDADVRELARAETRLNIGGRAGQSQVEILRNIDAMTVAVEDAGHTADFEVRDITAVHRALTAGTSNDNIAGKIRTEQNWIGGNAYNPCGAAFVPPPPEHVDRLLGDLCTALNEDHLPPLVQSAVVHAQFETIHPFADGNGRTGRALIHVILKRRGLAPDYVPPISVVLARRRDEYITGLTAFRAGDVTGWIEQFAVAAARSATLAQAYLTRVIALQDAWRVRIQRLRSDAAARRVIDVLPAHPVISVPTATVATGRTRAVVNQALGVLEQAGVLVRLGTSERNRTWEADGLLDLIGEFES